MKKFISKVKKATKDFFTNKSAFSLVELIVVIAIMAVMAAVLAPALLGYVERSRTQKDASAMGEVTNAIQLSLADQNVYDELLQYSEKDNYSCYCDGDTATNTDANKITTKEPDLWLFNDNARLLDETVYKPAGKMRGATVTFKPNGKAEYILKDGIVNKIGDDTTKKGTNGGAILENCPELYNRLRSTVGDTIKVSSQTYRNSDYTIFVSMGTTGGNQADKQDAIKVYGQYNGTNLPEVAAPVAGAGQGAPAGGSGGSGQPGGGAENLNRNGIIPTGATYTPNGGTAIVGNGTNTFPATPQTGDKYEEGDYIYKYNQYYDYSGSYISWSNNAAQNGWGVAVKNTSKKEYGAIISEIAEKPINMLSYTFYNCCYLTTAPVIPNSVTNMTCTFRECTQLATAPVIPSSVTDMSNTFNGCHSLATPPDMSNANSVTYMGYTFKGCYSLATAPTIPNSVTSMYGTFQGCTSLTTAPTIPNDVTDMERTFYNCTSLTGTIEVNANPTDYDRCLYSTQITGITGSCSQATKNNLMSTK